MRKLITTLMLLQLICPVWAQLQIEDTSLVTRERWRDTCFGLINKDATQIPSGYLIDYSLAAINKDFDGTGTNDTIQAWGDFFYYYNILELSKVNSNGNLQPTNDLFINAKRYLRDNNGTVPLLFLYQPYQQINPTALSNNLFTITSDSIRLMDVAGRPSSPYLPKELFMFSPITSYISQFNAITFSFPTSFWKMAGITSVSIDFDDGQGNRSVSQGGTASVYYATEGYKNITATINTANGSRTAKCRIRYARPPYYIKADTTWNISVAPVYTDENSYLGTGRSSGPTSICDAGTVFDRVNCDINPGAEVRVINGCDQVFDRPIIIVEGFDTDNGLTLDVLFNRFSSYRFIDNMRSAGYDFVFVNFKKPTDFIENNAKVLEEVVNRVNATKVGTVRGAVIGYSMGGLVARWCLKDMEDRSIDHKIAHYFSYDAPQQGANIPLGLQYFFGELEKDFSYLKWKNWGGSPIIPPFYQLAASAQSAAAKQMLVTKGNYNNDLFNWNPTLNTLDPIRAAFAQRLVQKGYPQNLTRHGIAFGRGNNVVNTKQAGNGNQFGNFASGSKIFDGNITFVLVNLTSSAFAVPENGNTDYICRYKFLGYKVVRLFNINIGTLPTLRIRNFKYTGQYPYDDAPGSYETTQSQFVEQINPINGLASHASNEGHHGHNFVSTVSALDMQNQGYSVNNAWQSNSVFFNVDNNIVNPGQVAGNTIASTLSPFNNVLTYTSDCGTTFCQSINDDVDGDGLIDIRNNNWNQYHNGFISNQASQYIQRKILNAVPGTTCPGLCNNFNTINGPASFCTTATYQLLGGNINGLNINWQSENGTFVVTNGQGTAQISVSILVSGTDFVRVTLSNSCGSTRVIRIPITVGPKTASNIIGLNPPLAVSPGEILDLSVSESGNSYLWEVEGGIILGSNSQQNVVIQVNQCPPNVTNGYINVHVTITDACGTGDTYTEWTTVDCSTGGPYFAMSPNPATNNVTIDGSARNKKIKEVRFIDRFGNIKRVVTYPGNLTIVNINISGLTSGIYFVRIFDGQRWESKSLSIQ